MLHVILLCAKQKIDNKTTYLVSNHNTPRHSKVAFPFPNIAKRALGLRPFQLWVLSLKKGEGESLCVEIRALAIAVLQAAWSVIRLPSLATGPDREIMQQVD